MTMPPGGQLIRRQHWDEHLSWMRGNWQPGQHIASIGPTGEGKTTYNVGLLGLRKYPLALDPKGRDETLSASGWARVESLPPPPATSPLAPSWWREQYGRRATKDGRRWEETWQAIDAGQPAPMIVG